MAENVDVNINAKVTGGDDVKQLGDDTKKAAGAAQSLKAQIRETTQAIQKLEQSGKASGKELNDLRNKLDDLNDASDRAKFKSGQFGDQLASLPGPLGKIGGGLKSVGDSFATFGKTLTISLGIVGLLVTAFIAIKSSLEKTKEGQQGLAKATTALNKVLSPFFALLEKVGNAVLPIITTGFEKLGSVMSKVAKFFGATDAKINEVTDSLEKNNEYATKLAEDEANRIKKGEEAAAKDEEARKQRFAERLAMMQANDKIDEAQLAKLKANALATADTEQEKLDIERDYAKKSFEQKQKDLKDLQANYAVGSKEFKDYQAQLLSLEATYTQEKTAFRQKQTEINKENVKKEFDNEIKGLELRNAQGLLTESEYQKELYDTAIKYGQDIENATIKYEDFKTKLRKENAQEARVLTIMELQDQINALDNANAAIEGDFQQDQERLLRKKELIKKQRDEELKNVEKDLVKKAEIIKKYADQEQAVDKSITESKRAENEARLAIQSKYIDLFGQFGQLLGQIAGKNKAIAIAGLLIEKGAAIAKIITQMNTVPAILPPGIPNPAFIPARIGGALSIASVVAASVQGINQINSAASAAGVSGGGGVSTPSGTPPSFAAPAGTSIPQVQTGGQVNPTTQIAGTLAQATGKPVQAYVVSSQLSSQQALDRRTNVASTFN